MKANVNLEGFQREKYFARSWALLTMDKGWIKPVIILSLFQLIPIIGQLILLGYCVEWARLTAWGVNSAPKQSNIEWGTCLSTGFKVFVVGLVWGLLAGIIMMVLMFIPLIGSVASLVITLAIEVVVMVAGMRAAIYQEIGPGLKFNRIFEMCRHDSEGLLRIIGMRMIWSAVLGVIVSVIMVIVMAIMAPSIAAAAQNMNYMTEQEAVTAIIQMLLPLIPVMLVVFLIALPFMTVLTMLSYTAVGLWLRQFNVPAWGRSEDPLPPFINPINYGYGQPYQTNVYGTGNADAYRQYQQPTQYSDQNVYQPATYDPAVYQAPAADAAQDYAAAASELPAPGADAADPSVVEVVPLSPAPAAEAAPAAVAPAVEAPIEALAVAEGLDPLFWDAAQLVVDAGRASVTSIQNNLSIGHSRAQRIMDMLEAKGIVGPANGRRPRSVLVDAAGLDALKGAL